MEKNRMSVEYIDLILGGESSLETIRPQDLKYFLQDEANGEIKILEIDQTFDGWDTMEVVYKAS